MRICVVCGATTTAPGSLQSCPFCHGQLTYMDDGPTVFPPCMRVCINPDCAFSVWDTTGRLEECPRCGHTMRRQENNTVAIHYPDPTAVAYPTYSTGERRQFATGSVRDNRKGKGRFDLIWVGFLRRIAGIMERGAEHYGDRNWEKGQPVMSSVDSAFRHLTQFIERQDDEDHIAAVAVNAMFAMFTVWMIQRGLLSEDLDDRPRYG